MIKDWPNLTRRGVQTEAYRSLDTQRSVGRRIHNYHRIGEVKRLPSRRKRVVNGL